MIQGRARQFPALWFESSPAELFTRARVAKPANTLLEPTAEKRGSGNPLGSLMNFSTKPADTNRFVRRHVRTGDPF